MKVLFLNPPFKSEFGQFSREQRSPAITKSGTMYYPMWLAYAAAFLEDKGHECKLIDAPAKRRTWDEVFKEIKEFSPGLAVIDTATASIENDVQVAGELKEKLGVFTLLVGPHVSSLPEDTLKMSAKIDAVARREYEHTVYDLVQALQDKDFEISKLKNVAGLSFRNKDTIMHAPERQLIENLDEFPFVSHAYKKHLDHHDYFYAHSKYPILTLIMERGCPYKCVYCVLPQTFNSHKVRYRSIKNVVDEIEYVLKEFPDLKEIMFEDDTFTIHKKRCIEFSQEILKRGIQFEFTCNARADVDLETLEWLKKAGCRLFCVGIESGDQQMLNNMEKRLKKEKVYRFFEDTKKVGIKVHGCFLVGNPGETKTTLETTLHFAKELNPNTAQFFPIMIYPGTAAYKWAEANGYIKARSFSEWLTQDGLHNSVVNTPQVSSKELVEFCDRARREFYLRPSYIMSKLKECMKEPSEFKRVFKGVKMLVPHLLRGSFKSAKA